MRQAITLFRQLKMLNRLTYHLTRGLIRVLGHLPWWLIHVLCHFVGWLAGSVIRYRHRVVMTNLQHSLPELTDRERSRVARDFYRQFAYNLISTPKLLRQPAEVLMSRHFPLEGLELLEEAGRKYSNALLTLGHYGNWELYSTGQIALSQVGYQMDQVYRPLNAEVLDRVQSEERRRHGANLVPKAQLIRYLSRHILQPEGKHWITALIMDQAPGEGHAHYFTEFLHQPTAMLDGAERLARKYRLPVFYLDLERLSPTCFRGRFIQLYDPEEELAPFALTERYARHLEATIRRDPAPWLWSHRRWKRPLADYPEATLSAELAEKLGRQQPHQLH